MRGHGQGYSLLALNERSLFCLFYPGSERTQEQVPIEIVNMGRQFKCVGVIEGLLRLDCRPYFR